MGRKRAILIAGPTASGKSAAGLRLAGRLDGVIVNADSMQVYRDLRILTARPTDEEERLAPHRLYGHVDAGDAYSVARWLTDVAGVLRELDAEGRRAIFVGGTGLYFNALTQGLSPMPPVDIEVRAYWREEAQRRPARELHRELQRIDPTGAELVRPSDTQRIVRALEVAQSTGRSLASWHLESGEPLLAPGTWRGIVVAPERDENYALADRRFDAMMAAGALGEAAALRARRLSPELPAMRALGVAPLVEHLAGSLGLDEAVELGKRQTRNYVKRQMTWLRRYMIAWRWIHGK